jgi:sulfite reductase (ferredoxin)
MTPQNITHSVEIQTTPIPQRILEEIEVFEGEAQKVLAGTLSADLFKPFRLQHGIYGQRQPGVHMVRIKIPFGGLTANQLRRIAELAETYATGVGHVTTRQDIQLHFVSLKDVGTIMRKLAEVGLTTREACGNTVRNVTACHLAGVCPHEVFDVTPYAKTVALHLLRNPLNQSLPRKFKIAFSGCHHDCALTPIHDIGLMAARSTDGTIGFRMSVGGGLGSAPRMGHVLREFVPMSELIPSIEAVIKVFDTLGNRKNRHKARLKFVIEKLGFDEFKRRWETAYSATGHAQADHPRLRLLTHRDNPGSLIMPAPLRQRVPEETGQRAQKATEAGNGQGSDCAAFARWKQTNVIPQKQVGYVAVAIRLPLGDVTAQQMLAIADLGEQYANGNIRTTIHQNMLIRWVPEPLVAEVYNGLAAVSLADPGADRVEDIVACPGTDTCGLGITSSKGLARALAQLFPPGRVPEDLEHVSIKISGCHNACAQHHIATIGLHGVGKRLGDHVAPYYELHLGGRINGGVKFGQMTIKLPARRVPAAIAHLLALYRRDRKPGEDLPAFIDRVGKSALKEELIPFTIVPTFEEDPTFFYDWEGDAPFVTEDLGPGECAGGALEMMGDRILEAEQELYHAKLFLENHQYAMSVNKAYRAVLAAAKALLVTEGVDPSTDADTFAEFEQRLAAKGFVPAFYRNLATQFGDLGPKETTGEFARAKVEFARGFVQVCKDACDRVGQDLKLSPAEPRGTTPTSVVMPPQSPATSSSRGVVSVFDLRGVPCPLNYVKTKLKLEMMDRGEQLEIWLDAGEPVKNVPMSLRNDGHRILLQEPLDQEHAHYRVLVQKGEG